MLSMDVVKCIAHEVDKYDIAFTEDGIEEEYVVVVHGDVWEYVPEDMTLNEFEKLVNAALKYGVFYSLDEPDARRYTTNYELQIDHDNAVIRGTLHFCPLKVLMEI